MTTETTTNKPTIKAQVIAVLPRMQGNKTYNAAAIKAQFLPDLSTDQIRDALASIAGSHGLRKIGAGQYNRKGRRVL